MTVGLVLGSLILYLKGMRIMMFQLSGSLYRQFSAPRAAARLDVVTQDGQVWAQSVVGGRGLGISGISVWGPRGEEFCFFAWRL